MEQPRQTQETIRVSQLGRRPKRPTGSYVAAKVQNVKTKTNYINFLTPNIKDIFISSVDNKVLLDSLYEEAFPSISKQIINPIFGGFNVYSLLPPVKDEDTHEVRGYKITIKKVRSYRRQNNVTIQLHFLNNTIRYVMMKLGYMQIGRTGKYYHKDGKFQITKDLSLYPGMKVNFVMGQHQRLFLRIQPTSKIVQNCTVLEFIDALYAQNRHQDKERKRHIVNEALANKIVMTNYGRTRCVRVESVRFLNLSEVFVPVNSNTNILQYYQIRYNTRIAHKNQPLLSIEDKKKKDSGPIYMLPELCLMTGIPDDIDECRRRAISEKTIVPPRHKLQAIQGLITRINEAPEIDCLKHLNINISNKLQEIDAIVLPSPTIQLGKDFVERGKQTGFNLFSQKLFDTGNEIKLALIYFDRVLAGELESQIRGTGKSLGLNISIENFKVGSSNSHSSLNQLKNQLQSAAKEAVTKKNCNCCLIVIRNDMKGHYKSIKKYCLDSLKVVSQVVVEGTLKKKNARSIHTKILLQTAVKAGNTLWAPRISPHIQGKTMLVSFDISKAGKVRKLTGVATVNDTLTRYTSESINLQQTTSKFKQMSAILLKFVTKYITRNKKVPQEIIILSNSCPNNQVKLLHEFFVDQATEELMKISPQIKLIVVQIKDLTNERFFTKGGDGEICNPNAGLLVNSTIVSDHYDFFLVSQKPRMGCSVPIHFVVVYSNSSLQEGILQELMYTQCFNYANWTGSIKIPAIMQYAKKLARFSSEVLDEMNVEGNLCNRLYFI